MASPERQLTVRAIATGVLLGALLAPCNIYTGLKIGFSFNMSIAAALVSYAFWNSLAHFGKSPRWGLLENNINQTAASAAASILSAGLVAPIPALQLISGEPFHYPMLVAWVFVVSFAGIICALAVRRQMLDRDGLPFPNGVATAETITEIYSRGKEAAYRIKLLMAAGIIAGGVKLWDAFIFKITLPQLPASWGYAAPPNVVQKGLDFISWRAIGLNLSPSLLLYGFGAIVGPRVGISLLLGTIIGWMILPRELLAEGWIEPALDGLWYGKIYEWTIWPGVTLMAAAALMSFFISLARIFWQKQQAETAAEAAAVDENADYEPGGERHFPRSWFIAGCVIALILSVIAQQAFFDIPIWLGAVAFMLSFVLAIIAGRVSGETGIPPIGALGKITQVTFGFLAPANTTINLMAANVTGGAAGQCSDMLHDLKTGKLIGANMKAQAIAQVFGIISGSIAGCAAYKILISDPQKQLLTEEWPAPAVAAWKTIAEVLAEGFHAVPEGATSAMAIAGVIGIILAVAEAMLPEKAKVFVPSASSLGFALIIPPFINIAMFLGSMIGVIAKLINKHWAAKYVIVIAAGLVAGESLAGVIDALAQFLGLKG
ncbi:OPT family oligopeptide transporter [Cerasicoccus fimbriatus]|uniref:OPT family oligopeptide transporter n=1 Tax=Cerasicoccus fimbriatus TaxID=3014554 RepID=UPI0022B3683F|nr:OPT family oligopeptide transporter [Cerasicoccus sp. TK19100]